MSEDIKSQSPESTDAPVAPAVQLTIADLQMLARVVDLASRRGAFHASELTQVGEAYEKLAAFLAHVESEKPQEPTAE